MQDIDQFLTYMKLVKGRVKDTLMLWNFKIETKDFLQIFTCHRYCKTINISNIEWRESEDIEKIKMNSKTEWSVETIGMCSPKNMDKKHFKKLIKKLSEIDSLKKSLKRFVIKEWPFPAEKAKSILDKFGFKIEKFES